MAESHREEIAKLEALYAGNPGGRVFVHLAEAYRKAGEHERARRILDEGLARHSDSASGYVVLGRVLADMQVADEAEAAFRRVLELDRGNLVALRWLGDIARQHGRGHEAVAHYRELLARNPSNEEVRDLVEIVEREAAGHPADAAPADTAPEWTEPEPEPAADAAPLTPLSAAPGQTGETEEAPVEFALVDIQAESATPPDAPARVSEDAIPVMGAYESETPDAAPDIDTEGLVVESFDALDAGDVDELSSLARSDDADALDIHLLDPAYADEADDASTEYADEAFIADLMSSGSEPADPEQLQADSVDLLHGGALTIDEASLASVIDDETAAAEPAPVADEAPAAAVDAFEPLSALSEEPAEEEPPVVADEPAPAPWQAPGVRETLDSIAAEWGEDEIVDSETEPAAAGIDEPATAPEALTDALFGAPEPDDGVEPGHMDVVADEPATTLDAELVDTASEPMPDEAEEDAVAEDVTGSDIGLVTETMAELYRSQGFHDRAAEVYRALLRQRPYDLRLSAKLSEAEADAAAAASQKAASAEPEFDDEAAGEVWLRGAGAPWQAGAEAPDAASPYAWTPEPDDQPAGSPISSYLRDLVSWKTATQRWAETPPPPPPPAQSPAWSPDSEPWGTSPTADPWGITEGAESVDPWGSPAPAGESPVGSEPEPAPTAGTPAAEPVEPAAEPEPGAAAEPADPWLSGTTEPPADPWGGAALQPQDGDPWVPAAPARAEPASSAGESPAAPAESGTDDEDEDLEMFRSWLQSLKK